MARLMNGAFLLPPQPTPFTSALSPSPVPTHPIPTPHLTPPLTYHPYHATASSTLPPSAPKQTRIDTDTALKPSN